MGNKRLKKCSASTDVEATTEPSQKLELDDLEQVVLKKQKKESDEDENTALKKNELEEHDCCFDNKDAFRNNVRTIFVRGFDCSLKRDDVKSALKKHFSSCGEISRVFVPIECKTGSPLGFAFINMREDEKKALTLDGSYFGSLKLEVMMAHCRDEYYGYTNFHGCKRCHRLLFKRRYDNFIKTNGGRIQPRTAEFECMRAELRKKVKAKNHKKKVEAENHKKKVEAENHS